MIFYSRIPLRFRAEFKTPIETWAKSIGAPVAEFGSVDLIRRKDGPDWHVAPEREDDEEKLKAWS